MISLRCSDSLYSSPVTVFQRQSVDFVIAQQRRSCLQYFAFNDTQSQSDNQHVLVWLTAVLWMWWTRFFFPSGVVRSFPIIYLDILLGEIDTNDLRNIPLHVFFPPDYVSMKRQSTVYTCIFQTCQETRTQSRIFFWCFLKMDLYHILEYIPVKFTGLPRSPSGLANLTARSRGITQGSVSRI